jgi:hypothetical protein
MAGPMALCRVSWQELVEKQPGRGGEEPKREEWWGGHVEDVVSAAPLLGRRKPNGLGASPRASSALERHAIPGCLTSVPKSVRFLTN